MICCPGSKPRRHRQTGQGRIWVTNFGSDSVSVIDPGTRRSPCPIATYPLSDHPGPGAQPQGIAVDMDGNVWVANNFINDKVCLEGAAIPPSGEGSTVGEERLQPQCGGNGAVVVFGIAGPVAAPLIGPPEHP